MSPTDDDDDWVGPPPEGHYSRDRAKPEFWWRQKPIVPAFVGISLVVVVILLVVLLSCRPGSAAPPRRRTRARREQRERRARPRRQPPVGRQPRARDDEQ